MKIRLLVPAIVLVALAGCGSHAATTPPPATTPEAPPTTIVRAVAATTTTMSEESRLNLAFHQVAADQGWDFAKAKRVAVETCELLDTVTLREIIEHLAVTGVIDSSNAATVGRMIGAGIPAYCPEYRGQIESLGQ